MPRAKCQLFVIPARDKPVAIIIRRGPSAWYHLILWETRRKNRDLFTHGAWFRGRIFPEKCDLSPDGNLFVYFAFQGSRRGTVYQDSYTAVSRPPWLYAVALWPHGGTYGGGGRFLDKHYAHGTQWKTAFSPSVETHSGRSRRLRLSHFHGRSPRCGLSGTRFRGARHLHSRRQAFSASEGGSSCQRRRTCRLHRTSTRSAACPGMGDAAVLSEVCVKSAWRAGRTNSLRIGARPWLHQVAVLS